MNIQSPATLKPGRPQHVRQLLERLGPGFVKLGQFLSLRPDLIPAEYAEEFLVLTDQVQPVPFEALRAVVEEDLGDLGSRFTFFDARPLATGSLAQVHGARTLDGHEVAVKILRPGVEAAIRTDLRKAHSVARVLGHLGLSSTVSPKQVVAELEQLLNEELDLEAELRNVVRMRALCADSDIMVVPRPYPELSTRRILTCERLRGKPFSEILRNVRAGREDLVTRLGHDLEQLANNLLETVLVQIFRYEFFHADIHPGNLLALSGDRIGLLDLALTDGLDPIIRRGTAQYLTAAADEDPSGMYRALTDVLRVTEDTDLDSFRAEFTAATRSLLRDRARATGGTDQGHFVRSYMVSLMQTARSNGLVVPPAMLSLYRSLLAAETIVAQLDVGTDVITAVRRFFRRLQLESFLAALDATQVQRTGLQLIELLQNGPGHLARLLEDVANERFVLRVRSADAAERRRQHNARVQLTTLGLVAVSVAILVAGAPPGLMWGWLPLRTVLIAALAVVYLALTRRWRGLR